MIRTLEAALGAPSVIIEIMVIILLINLGCWKYRRERFFANICSLRYFGCWKYRRGKLERVINYALSAVFTWNTISERIDFVFLSFFVIVFVILLYLYLHFRLYGRVLKISFMILCETITGVVFIIIKLLRFFSCFEITAVGLMWLHGGSMVYIRADRNPQVSKWISILSFSFGLFYQFLCLICSNLK